MDKHYGQIVEHVVRRNGYNITTLAGKLNINRRSIYNWFSSNLLKKTTIHQIGLVIRHDFSNEFPELFDSNAFESIYKPKMIASRNDNLEQIDSEQWKIKYIELLEKYNRFLIKN